MALHTLLRRLAAPIRNVVLVFRISVGMVLISQEVINCILIVVPWKRDGLIEVQMPVLVGCLLTSFLHGDLVTQKRKGVAVRDKIAREKMVETLENYSVYSKK